MVGVVDGEVVWLDVRLVVADSVCHVVAARVVVGGAMVVGVVLVRALVGVVGGEREAVRVPVEVGDAGAVVVRVGLAAVADGSEVAAERVVVALVVSKAVPVLANVEEAVAGVVTYLVLAMERSGKRPEV